MLSQCRLLFSLTAACPHPTHSAKGTEALNKVLALRMQSLAAQARPHGALGEEDIKNLSAGEREELMQKVRKARTSSAGDEHHPKFLHELDPTDGRKLTDALELHGEFAMLAIKCHPDKTRPAASVSCLPISPI